MEIIDGERWKEKIPSYDNLDEALNDVNCNIKVIIGKRF